MLRLLVGHRGFVRELRGGLARRGFVASPRNRCVAESPENQPSFDDTAKGTQAAPSVNERFHMLDKDLTIIKFQIDVIKSTLKDLSDKFDREFSSMDKKIDSKFDRLMLLIIGGVVLEGGLDFYRDKRDKKRVHNRSDKNNHSNNNQ